MILLRLPDESQLADGVAAKGGRAVGDGARLRDAAFYLAAEQWAASHLTDDCFMTWQVAPTVIFGRHQVAEAEFSAERCRELGIGMMRRRSGGGCVYADLHNVMLCFVVTVPDTVPDAFARITAFTARMLTRMGFDAEVSGRNDICLRGGGKVSGFAVYSLNLPGGVTRAVIHGTMLLEADTSLMDSLLTPERSKLVRHGVQSVSQRVDSLCRIDPSLTAERFRAHSEACVATGEYRFTSSDMAEIEALAEQYRRPEYIFKPET